MQDLEERIYNSGIEHVLAHLSYATDSLLQLCIPKRAEKRQEKNVPPIDNQINILQPKASKNEEKKENKKVETSELEDVTEESEELEISKDKTINISYSFHEEEFIASLYGSNNAPLDYVKMFYGESEKRRATFEAEDYWALLSEEKEETSQIMTDEEAQQTLVNAQYAEALGDRASIKNTDREKLDLWIMFNKSMFHTYEKMFSVTSDVNYAPMR